MKNIKTKAFTIFTSFTLLAAETITAYGVDDPVEAINKFSTLFKSIISAIGGVILLWATVQLGLAIKRRDPAAYPEALLGIVGGILIAAAPWVVSYITG